MEEKEIAKLLQKYQEGKCTEREKALIGAWYQQFNEQEAGPSNAEIASAQRQIFNRLPGNETHVIRFGTALIAACLLLGILLTVVYKFVFRQQPAVQKAFALIVPPGKDAAILTLSNGRQINLSTAKAGKLTSIPGSTAVKTSNGQLIYTPLADHKPAEQNTITTPAGGQWKMQLPDGTQVWLNASSSLTFPSTFAGQSSRQVSLTGEAYFEVAKDKAHPFLVITPQNEIKVLGTHFNVNAYADEPVQRTTLAEGRVVLSDHFGHIKNLLPGQQSVTAAGTTEVIPADTEAALAWTNGNFYFNEETISSAMRQLGRWYGVDIIVDPAVADKKLFGKISRHKNLDQVLRALEATKIFHCKMEGRRVFVMK